MVVEVIVCVLVRTGRHDARAVRRSKSFQFDQLFNRNSNYISVDKGHMRMSLMYQALTHVTLKAYHGTVARGRVFCWDNWLLRASCSTSPGDTHTQVVVEVIGCVLVRMGTGQAPFEKSSIGAEGLDFRYDFCEFRRANTDSG